MPANITFSKITGGRDVYAPDDMRSENIAIGGTSATGSLVSEIGDFVRIVATEDCYVIAGTAPVAAVGTSMFLPVGQVVDIGPMSSGYAVAVIAA